MALLLVESQVPVVVVSDDSQDQLKDPLDPARLDALMASANVGEGPVQNALLNAMDAPPQ